MSVQYIKLPCHGKYSESLTPVFCTFKTMCPLQTSYFDRIYSDRYCVAIWARDFLDILVIHWHYFLALDGYKRWQLLPKLDKSYLSLNVLFCFFFLFYPLGTMVNNIKSLESVFHWIPIDVSFVVLEEKKVLIIKQNYIFF